MSPEPPRIFILTIHSRQDKYDVTAHHLAEQGLKCEPFYGFDREICKLLPMDTFDVDRVGDHISRSHVAACLTHYLCWKVLEYIEGDAFWVLEYDAVMDAEWRKKYEPAMASLPDDWDIVFLGSCCCTGRPQKKVGEFLYEVQWPLCGHALMIRKKALPVLLTDHMKIWAPLDIAMFKTSLPKLRVYTILPSIIRQRDTAYPP